MLDLAGWADHEYCYLTTRGRRSGRPHRIEIWFVVHDAAVWLLTEHDPQPDWARNLRVTPEARLEIGGREGGVRGLVVDDLPPSAPQRALLAERYQASYGAEPLLPWARAALAVRLDPVAHGPA